MGVVSVCTVVACVVVLAVLGVEVGLGVEVVCGSTTCLDSAWSRSSSLYILGMVVRSSKLYIMDIGTVVLCGSHGSVVLVNLVLGILGFEDGCNKLDTNGLLFWSRLDFGCSGKLAPD